MRKHAGRGAAQRPGEPRSGEVDMPPGRAAASLTRRRLRGPASSAADCDESRSGELVTPLRPEAARRAKREAKREANLNQPAVDLDVGTLFWPLAKARKFDVFAQRGSPCKHKQIYKQYKQIRNKCKQKYKQIEANYKQR